MVAASSLDKWLSSVVRSNVTLSSKEMENIESAFKTIAQAVLWMDWWLLANLPNPEEAARLHKSLVAGG